MSVCSETLHVTIVIFGGNAHVIGVVAPYQCSGTDAANVSVSKGDNALSSAAREVGSRALVMEVVCRPAVATASHVRAVAGGMPQVLTVTFEAVDVGRECALSFSECASRWGAWVFDSSSLQAVLSFTVDWVGVWRSLCCMDSWDDTARRCSRPSAYKMGDQPCSDCRMS